MGSSDDELNGLQRLILPVATIYLYCAPCACLLATAFEICREAGTRATTYFKFLVRPDDRLVSSCCSRKDRSLGLASLIQTTREIEGPPFLANNLLLIARVWVEQRLQEAEEERDLPQPISTIAEMGGKVLAAHHPHRSEGKTAGIVILGELRYSLPIMRSPPFSSNPRRPKETEIFQLELRQFYGKYSWRSTFLGTYTPKAVPITSLNTPKLSKTLPSTSLVSTPVASKPVLPASSSPPKAPSSAQDTSAPRPPRQISPPPSPTAKRQKSSPASSVTMDEEAHL